MNKIVGRLAEIEMLDDILASEEAELLAVYGRRRVGKTYLIRNRFEKEMAFEFTGIHHVRLEQQLDNFTTAFWKRAGMSAGRPDNWQQAFEMLANYLTPLLKKKKRVIFFDEFPWINTPRSGFLSAFEHFWNTWASREKNLVVVICGSAAAWMIQKVIFNKGGLHNRVTKRMRLLPFTVAETAAYLKAKDINLDNYQILMLYMTMGGIPQYLKEIKPGESAIQAIDRICFTNEGFLQEEFKNLFRSLFDNSEDHMKVIRALSKKSTGMTRNEIIAACKLKSGGGVTLLLDDLLQSGFIGAYIPFERTTKDAIFKLSDEYSLFYLRFIEHSKFYGPGTWSRFALTQSWKTWAGYAFESICLKHITSMKRALGIEGIHAEPSTWRKQGNSDETGVQIDLLIDRQDFCINICEIKFTTQEFTLSKKYALELESKLKIFKNKTRTKKTLFLTIISTYGLSNPKAFPGLVNQQITMEALFR